MARVQLEKGEQARFLQAVKDRIPATWKQIAAACQVDQRTMLAWRNEEWQMSYKAWVKLSRLSGVPVPRILERYQEFSRWRKKASQNKKAIGY